MLYLTIILNWTVLVYIISEMKWNMWNEWAIFKDATTLQVMHL